MVFQDFISEAEAALKAGVSARTLQRFSEAGYLRVQVEPGGLRLYSRDEIEEIFGVHQGQTAEAQAAETRETDTPRHEESQQGEQQQQHEQFGAGSEAVEFAVTPPISAEGLEAVDSTAAQSPAEIEPAQETEAVTPPSANNNEERRDHIRDEETRLRNVIKTQEAILDLKEIEIRDLRSQRDWLQTRVERLEEKSERDQILLLSETQTIRRLISMQEHKRSAVKQFLEWIGLSSAKETQNLPAPASIVGEAARKKPVSPIEVPKAANQ